MNKSFGSHIPGTYNIYVPVHHFFEVAQFTVLLSFVCLQLHWQVKTTDAIVYDTQL